MPVNFIKWHLSHCSDELLNCRTHQIYIDMKHLQANNVHMFTLAAVTKRGL